jgi:urea transport system permease protein
MRTVKNRSMIAALLMLLAATLLCGRQAMAEGGDPKPLVAALAEGSFSDKAKAIEALAATGDPALVPLFDAFAEGRLFLRKADKAVVILKDDQAFDPLTGASLGKAETSALEKIKVNNNLRRVLKAAVSGLSMNSADPAARRKALEALIKSPDPAALAGLEQDIASEKDAGLKRLLEQARAAVVLRSDRPIAEKQAAIDIISSLEGMEALPLLTGARATADPALVPALDKAIGRIEQSRLLWDAGQNIWYGISLGSVLLLAAIGLAITFGVMGIINMAHGEVVMLGAYTTFLVQALLREHAPALNEWSLLIALPLAFFVTAGLGMVLERGMIRFLYGRPLETLLATWGVSLILQQAVRTAFGPTNQEVANPGWMSGAFALGGLTITYSRLWILAFSLAVFAVLFMVLTRTTIGLRMRAVTQNRRMAAAMGIRTPWIDAMTFALGSGIAGIAGVALSQIDNVSPNLGRGYIIDSFMVVVFGGVGNLWGTLVGAFSLGILNKFLEPFAGAVLGKILVLVLLILFIQKRPRGLFALKGRAVDA